MSAPGKIPSFETRDPVSQRAAVYFERRRFGPWSAADQAEFDAWMNESPLHEVAYLRVEGIAAHAERLSARGSTRFHPATKRLAQRRFAIPLLVAASIAMVVALGVPLLNSLMTSPDRTYATEVGGRTLISFADNTQIELNTDTLVHFRMTSRERTVWLEKGEAWFHVAHNAANPFTVIIGNHRVVDLGTEFLIRRDGEGMEVALLTGRATLSAKGSPTTMLKPGDDAVATTQMVVVTKRTSQELSDALAWRHGMLAFRNAALSDAVREVNRYSTTKVVIADPSVAAVKISADLKTDDTEGFLAFAQTVLNLRVEREGSVILISRETKKRGRHSP